MHLAILVVCQRILLQTGFYIAVGNDNLRLLRSLYHQFQDIQQFTRVAAAIAHQSTRLLQYDVLLAQFDILGDSSVEQFQQVVFIQRFQHIQLTSRQQWAYHLERRILRRSTYQRDDALLDSSQQRVLLRLREAMYLVYK